MNILAKCFSNLSILFHLVSSQQHLDIFAMDDGSVLPPRSLTEKSETVNNLGMMSKFYENDRFRGF